MPPGLRTALFQGGNSGYAFSNNKSSRIFQDLDSSHSLLRPFNDEIGNPLFDPVSGNIKGPFPCPLCDRSYQRQYSLDRHMLTHQGSGKHFTCPLCQANFTQKPSLKTHLRTIHVSGQCRICDHVFPLGEEFNKHLDQCLTQGLPVKFCAI